ncbi:lipase 1-like [Achroia grisella]|uniref:lipase 1-like n=1 Tax=Achroia grisella TaxID=688607 RepID=UPI0027D2D66E|nr:lipase 1-like [Achroia grisella]
MIKFALFAALVTVAVARRSPHADYIEELVKQNEGRYSTDVVEDALLDVPGLIRKYGYPVEVHTVVTSDNYVLEAHRIPHGRDQNNEPGVRPVVFLFHGLFSSSAEFLVLGPGTALAYLLAEAGFDVWLGNARGNYYSRNNLVLDPDDLRNPEFWKFGWEQIGNIDLPTLLDYVLAETGQSQLHYIGHSQGCTSLLVLNSLQPSYNEKVISFHALAPAAFFNNNELLAFKLGAHFSAPLEVRQVNTTLTPVILGHAPAGSSARQLSHFGQSITSKDFRRFNYLPIENIELYNRPVPPSYDLSQVDLNKI